MRFMILGRTKIRRIVVVGLLFASFILLTLAVALSGLTKGLSSRAQSTPGALTEKFDFTADNPYSKDFDGEWSVYSPSDGWKIQVDNENRFVNFASDITNSRYSTEFELLSPNLTLGNNQYSLSFDYRSTASADLPSEIRVTAVREGIFYPITAIDVCEQGDWTQVIADLTVLPQRILFAVKVYALNGQYGGVDLDNVSLQAKEYDEIDPEKMSVEFSSQQLLYNGTVQTPRFTVTHGGEGYAKTRVTQNDAPVQPISSGDYLYIVDWYSSDNRFIQSFKQEFTIAKANLSVSLPLVYRASQTKCAIYDTGINADAVDRLVYTFMDGETEVVSSVPAISGLTGNSLMVRITRDEDDNYTALDSGFIPLEVNTEMDFPLIVEKLSTVYNGSVQPIDALDGFASFYQNGTEAEPKNVGVYTVRLNFEIPLELEYQITPYEIDSAQFLFQSITKAYDGTDDFYYFDGNKMWTNCLPQDAFSQIALADDDAFIDADIRYGATTQKAPLRVNDYRVGGVDGQNYILTDNFATDIDLTEFEITFTQLQLLKNISDESAILHAVDREYDGTKTATLAPVDETQTQQIMWGGLASADKLNYGKLIATFDSADVGVRNVSLLLNDPRFADKYRDEIDLSVADKLPTGTIQPKTLTPSNQNVTVDDIPFGDEKITAQIVDITLDFVPTDALLLGDYGQLYTIEYIGAEVLSHDVGRTEVLLTGMYFVPNSPSVADILRNYVLPDLTVQGTIIPKVVSMVGTEIVLPPGVELPEITFTSPVNAYTADFYATELDATNNANPLRELPATKGVYYARITLNDIRYQLIDGFAILIVRVDTELIATTIKLNGEIADSNKVLPGFVMELDATVCSDKNNLIDGLVTMKIGLGGDFISLTGNTLTARAKGRATVVFTYIGNDGYAPSEKTVLFIVSGDPVSLYSKDAPFVGGTAKDTLPSLTATDKITVDGQVLETCINPREGVLKGGVHAYDYQFTATGYLGTYTVQHHISAQKIGLTAVFPDDIVLEYGKGTDFASFAVLYNVGDTQVEYSQLDDFVFSVALVIGLDAPDVGEYTVNFRFPVEGEGYTVLFECEDYQLSAITNTVGTSSVVVTIRPCDVRLSLNYVKEYASVIPDETVLRDSVQFDTELPEDIIERIRSSLSVAVFASQTSTVGRYAITLFNKDFVSPNYHLIMEDSFLAVVKSKVRVSPRTFNRKYLEETHPKDVDIEGSVLESDKLAIEAACRLYTTNVTTGSETGTYTVYLDLNMRSDNYDLTVTEGKYIISPAILTGFDFEGYSLLYDGKTHSVLLSYDEEVWAEVKVAYTVNDVIDPGVYLCTAEVSLKNYETLRLTTTLTILATSLQSGGGTGNGVTLFSPDEKGFMPDVQLTLSVSGNTTIREMTEKLLTESGAYRESILEIYEIGAYRESNRVNLGKEMYSIKLRLSGLESASGVRLLVYNGETVKEVEYKFENGYFVFESVSLDGIAVVKNFAIQTRPIESLIFAAVCALLAILALSVIVSAFISNSKNKQRSARRHHKWR